MVPGGAEAVDREAAQDGHVLRAMLGVDLGGVLAEGAVPREVEPVFDKPLRTNDLREPLRGGFLAGQIGDDANRPAAAPAGLQTVRWRMTRATCAAYGKSK